ncbi:ATP-binding cassette domain-containing protein [Streptomyces coeruleorubidus]|uniref:ATP-binding cassette domain-containing protein n=1 Tax=Streptomyces coeruleorubidus TaxID=116188 RepID=A0ABZ0KTW9_STRC4|nr:ATP-binding cassette domain-containing protein [Streptomyces coeruleorubidus]WOT40522.1 ATP-binding cassette domain-containing protein [Streptomyces coeruleorubidus]
MTDSPARGGLPSRGLRFLLARWRVLLRLTAWSVLETGQTFLIGYGPARALDDGFLRGRPDVGLAWLAVAGVGVLAGAYGTARVYAAVAALVEPFRDRLVERVVARGVRTGDAGSLSGLTQQVEIARDTFAGLVMVSRSFVFTAAGALAGLFTLAPPLLLVVGPPLAAGVALFAATLRPLARRQQAFLVADEALAGHLGTVCPGLRDITATGAEAHLAAATGERVKAEFRAARSLAHWGVLRVASLALGGQLPIVLLLATAPWLLAHGVTTGALVGALAYVTQSLLPALRNLIHGLGTSGSRLTVVLRRLAPAGSAETDGTGGDGTRSRTDRRPADTTNGSAGQRPAETTTPRAEQRPPDTAQQHPEPRPAPGTRADRPRGGLPGAARAADGTLHTPTASASDGTPRTPTAPASDGTLRTPTAPASDGTPRTPTAAGRTTSAGDSPPAPAPPALSLSSVTFAYGPAGTPVVEDLDLTLPAGSHLAVVGPSGAGKSTLTALVAGLLTPDRGTIAVGGHPVPGPEAAAARVLIPQEAYVFGGTLAENLAYLRPEPVPEEELMAAAGAVGLAPLAGRLGGLGARVDPAALSAGERQLVALTRAYLSYAPLALLDEATCHLDAEVEERAERAFAARPGGTLVVVAHRISSARRAGRVLVMDGRSAACGGHEELMRSSALYRDLVGSWAPAPSRRRSEPALSLRDADRVDAVAGPGLAGDGRHVIAHGPVGQVQAPGDLRDGGSLGREG